MTAIIQKIKNSDKPYYTKGEILQLLESSLPKNEWQAHFLESETRNLVYMNGEDWVRKNRKFLLAQLSYIWSL